MRYSNSIHPKMAKGSKHDSKDNDSGKKKTKKCKLFLATDDTDDDPIFSRKTTRKVNNDSLILLNHRIYGKNVKTMAKAVIQIQSG